MEKPTDGAKVEKPAIVVVVDPLLSMRTATTPNASVRMVWCGGAGFAKERDPLLSQITLPDSEAVREAKLRAIGDSLLQWVQQTEPLLYAQANTLALFWELPFFRIEQ